MQSSRRAPPLRLASDPLPYGDHRFARWQMGGRVAVGSLEVKKTAFVAQRSDIPRGIDVGLLACKQGASGTTLRLGPFFRWLWPFRRQCPASLTLLASKQCQGNELRNETASTNLA